MGVYRDEDARAERGGTTQETPEALLDDLQRLARPIRAEYVQADLPALQPVQIVSLLRTEGRDCVPLIGEASEEWSNKQCVLGVSGQVQNQWKPEDIVHF